MKLKPLMCAVAGALALTAPAWAQESQPAASNLATIRVDASDAQPTTIAMAGNDLVSATPAAAYRTGILESVRWRPRPWRRERPQDDNWDTHNGPIGYSQIHAGFFDPDGDNRNTGFLLGARGGLGADEHINLGLGVDWIHRQERVTELVSTAPLPGGGNSERRLELARSSSNQFPLMGYVQFMPGSPSTVTPYFGVGGGYEVLFLSAEDFTTGEKFDATYGGWGWQGWAGISVPMSNRSRFMGEVFRNQSTVGRDVTDQTNGVTYREEVPLDGLGMRFGLSWGF